MKEDIKNKILSCCNDGSNLKLSGKNNSEENYSIQIDRSDLQDGINYHLHSQNPEWDPLKLDRLVEEIENCVASGGDHRFSIVGADSLKEQFVSSNFSDYVVYVDESGDHGLNNVNQDFPAFALSFCIVKKEDYIQQIVPKVQRLKFDYWGHDRVILREHDIRKEKGEFGLLRTNAAIRTSFYARLNQIMISAPITIVAAVILKNKLKEKYATPFNPYDIALRFCMEQALSFLLMHGQKSKKAHIVVESRGKNEDAALELEFGCF